MRKLFIITFLMTLSALYAWEKTYGGSGKENVYQVRQTYDKGYIIVGSKEMSPNSSDQKMYLIRTNSKGDILWEKTYPEGKNKDVSSGGHCVQQAFDKGYVVVGDIYKGEERETDFYLIKTDSIGDTIWTRSYHKGMEGGFWVEQTLDGGYILTGWSLTYPYGYVIWTIKTDSIGDTLWTRTYPNKSGGFIAGRCVRQTSDKGYIILGNIERGVSAVFNIILLKLNSNGDTLWTKIYGYGGDTTEYPEVIQETSDNGYIIVGTIEPSSGKMAIYLIKTDEKGDILWTKTYRGRGEAWGNYIQQTSDGGYIIVGSTTDGRGSEVYLLKTDKNGDSLWAKTYSGSHPANGNCVQETSDKGYIIVGEIWPDTTLENIDIYLIKTDSLGNSEEEPAVEERVLNKRPLFLSITPNPAKGEAIIRFGGRTFKPSRLSLYDINGRKVMELWKGRLNKNHSLRLNEKELPSGIYFLQLEAGGYIKRGKVIVE